MAESKHTPGPWRVEEGTTLVWGDCNPDDTTSYGMGYPIAECRVTPSALWAKGPRKYEEGEANARLISAAPELLELVAQYRSDLMHFPAPDSIERRLKAIEAVIAKATGVTA